MSTLDSIELKTGFGDKLKLNDTSGRVAAI
jgi:hypothetical protein